jgi:hypothetical protein
LLLFTLGTPHLEIEGGGGLKASVGVGKPLALFTFLAFALTTAAEAHRPDYVD